MVIRHGTRFPGVKKTKFMLDNLSWLRNLIVQRQAEGRSNLTSWGNISKEKISILLRSTLQFTIGCPSELVIPLQARAEHAARPHRVWQH